MLTVRDIYKSYDGHVALQGVSFDVKQGEVFGIIGPNGAGKTTLLKIIVGLLKPDKGEIKINNINIQTNPVEVKKMLGYVPEELFLYEKLSGKEFLNFIGDIKGLSTVNKQIGIENFLQMFDLHKRGNDFIETYSHGMKKKIAIAAAFIGSPMILLLDEPFNGLDSHSIYVTKKLIMDKANEGTTVLISTHILNLVEELCDRVMILNRGKIAGIETIDSNQRVRMKSKLEEAFIKMTT